MNIRHKTTGEEFELIDKCGQEWAVYDANGERRLFKEDKLVEIPPEPQWVDVTARCVVDDYKNAIGQFISIIDNEPSNPNFVGANVLNKDNGYRLRKVQGADVQPSHWAFVVERKKP